MSEGFLSASLRVRHRHSPIPDNPTRRSVLLDGETIGYVWHTDGGFCGVTVTGRAALTQGRLMDQVYCVLDEHLKAQTETVQAREAS